jgi:hypothetical protein
MITRNTRLATIVLAGTSFALVAGTARAQTPIRYTGDISPTFGLVNDTCAFEITLWDATADGTRIGPAIERELPVRDGRYETELDFGFKAASDRSHYLQVAVGCPAGTAGLTTLTRRAFHPGSTTRPNLRDRDALRTTGDGAPLKAALGTAFTYQGELQESGAPVTGSGDFQFSLWDALQGGSQIGATVSTNGVAVENGRFTASLDFGAAAFDGDARWLEITVDYPSGTGSFTPLSPRQPLSAAPYALQTRGIFVNDAGNVGIGTATPADPFHVVGSTTLDGALRIESGQGIQFPDFTNRIYQDLGDLRLESGDDVLIFPADELNVDSDTLVVDSATNRVGIGTPSPSADLEVTGDSVFTGNVTIGSSIVNTLSMTGDLELNGNIEMQTGNWIGSGPASTLLVFDDVGADLSILAADFGIGTTSPDEMLHVRNSTASGLAFLKLQTSHPSDWGETGVRFETPQNRWHLRMDDDSNNNIPEGALGLRCNTPGHEIMTWTEDGNVGVGTTQPTAELDVVGDLELSGAYRGHLGPNNGAPFPRPAFDSGWVSIGQGTTITLTHGIGGNAEDYLVDFQFRNDGTIIHNQFIGGLDPGQDANPLGAYWRELTTSSIKVFRYHDDFVCDEIRIRVWVVN